MGGAFVAIHGLRKLETDHDKMEADYKSKKKSLRTELKAQLAFHVLLRQLKDKEMEELADRDYFVYANNPFGLHPFGIHPVLGRDEPVHEDVYLVRLREISEQWGYKIDNRAHFRRIES